MNNMMQVKNEYFSMLLGKFNRLWGFIINFRSVLLPELGTARGRLQKEFINFLHKLRRDPIFSKSLTIAEDRFASSANQIANSSIQQANTNVDAASIVFAHSILDAFLFDLLRFSSELNREGWYKYLANRKIPFDDLLKKDKSQIEKEVLEKYMKDLGYKSLPAKCDHLHWICSPPLGWQPFEKNDYRYDKSQIESIDILRHNIVHGLQLDTQIDDTDGKLEYLKYTGEYFCLMVHDKYSLKFIDTYWLAALQKDPEDFLKKYFDSLL